MKPSLSKIFPACALLIAATALHAQHGCAQSPEAPTDILMLVGSAGMFYGSFVFRKLVRRK